MSLREQYLREYLGSLGVPLEQWGTGSAKTVGHLVKELRHRECRLNGVVREAHTVIVDLRYGDCQLREVCQVFHDGRIRDGRGLPGEKLHIGERPLLGFRRCLRQELGILIGRGYAGVHELGGDVKIGMSSSYPGILTRNVHVYFTYEMPKKFFKKHGYVEWQPDKSTYFDWFPVEQ